MSLLRSVYIFLALISASLFSETLLAQDYSFKRVGLSDGLSNSHVNAILKDNYGFVWFGTASGLNRWNGYDMTVFSSDSRNARSLPDSYIKSVQMSGDGSLWVETGSGYAIYDPETEDFNREIGAVLAKMGVEGDPEIIRIDRSGNVWASVPGEGVFYYRTMQKLMYEFSFDDSDSGLPDGEIVSLDECEEGMVCCYDNGLLTCIDGNHHKVIWETDYIVAAGGRTNDQYHSFADRKDNLWIWNSGELYIYKKQSETWLSSLSALASEWKTSAPSLDDDRITDIAQGNDGLVWVATENSGIILADPSSKSISRLQERSEGARALNTRNIQTIFKDNQGVMWLGSSKNGIFYYYPDQFRFHLDESVGDVTAIRYDANGGMWLGTSESGVIFRSSNGQQREFRHIPDGLSSNSVTALAISGNRVFVGSSRGGVCVIEGNKVYDLPVEAENFNIGPVQALETDALGNLWIGTQGFGLVYWSASSHSITRYDVSTKSLASDNVMCLCKAGNKLLAGTGAGLTVMSLDKRKFRTYVGNSQGNVSLKNTSVTSVSGDRKGRWWIGTRAGLAVYNPANDQMVELGREQGLDDGAILAITEDSKSNIWITTATGVSEIVVQDNRALADDGAFIVYNYDETDGLLSSSFNLNCIFASKDGKLLFGGMDGLNTYVPDKNKAEAPKDRILFTHLFVNGDEVSAGSGVFSEAIYAAHSISVPYHADIRLSISSDCFARSERLQYLYTLDGIDKTWRSGNVSTHAIEYSKLSPGKHVLHVKAVNLSGSGKETTIIINVEYPFWLSMKGFVLYAVILALIIIWLIRIKPRRKKYWSEFSRMKDQMSSIRDICAEIATPASTMIPPLNALVEQETDKTKREYLTTIHYQTLQMLGLVNKLEQEVDNEKIEDTVVQMSVIDRKKDTESLDERTDIQSQEKKERPVVLIVDENTEFLDMLEATLSSSFTIWKSETAENALRMVYKSAPSLVVADSEMEGMTGSELCVKLKTNRDYDRIPFILLTDSASASMIGDNGINNKVTTSADDYLAKPFNINVLEMHINNLLGIKGETKEMSAVDQESDMESMAISATLDEQLRINAEQFVLQNISRPTLSVEEMAHTLKMSRAHLYKKLTAITGLTPIEFIRQIRIRQSALLLKQGTYNVSEVAYEVGFNNPKLFSRYFKDEFGLLPSQYLHGTR